MSSPPEHSIPFNPHTVVSVVVPLHQDADLLPSLLPELSCTLSAAFRFHEVILVDDASTDETSDTVADLLKEWQKIRYVRLSRSFGRDVCLSAGLESAIGDYVVTMDPRTDPADAIPEMVALCQKTGGIVHGEARNPRRRGLLRNAFGRVFRQYCLQQLGVDLKRGVADFRVLSRQAVNALLQIREQGRYLRVLTLSIGYKQDFYRYPAISRGRDGRRPRLSSELATAVHLITSNTRHPLRVVSLAGLTGAALNLLYALYVLAIYLFFSSVAAGWTSLSLQVSGMFFFVCLILAVLSEYVGTILGEVRSRPLYFVSGEQNSSVLLEDTVHSSIVKESEAAPAGS